MGMFDWVRCTYPLPAGAPVDGYQTKDTPRQFLDHYEIREDGTLWREDYDIEDHSDPSATGIMRIVGCMARVNERWIQEDDFTGEVRFYGSRTPLGTEWDFSAYFVKGKLRHLEQIAPDREE
nr:hypothetical protein [Burkholderiales bacterium]